MNKNITAAISNLEEAMTKVRTLDNFEVALYNFFATCFMQDPFDGTWEVRGTKMILASSTTRGFVTFSYESDNGTRTITLSGFSVVDLVIHESEIRSMTSLMKDDGQYFIKDVLWALVETLEQYLRKEAK